MTMLPDIDATDWEEYQRQQLAQQIQSKVDSFGLQQAIGDKVSDLHSLLGANTEPAPPPPEPPPPPTPSYAEQRANAIPPPEPAPQAQPLPPEPSPQPAAPTPAPQDSGSVSALGQPLPAGVTQDVAPTPAPPPAPAPPTSPAPTSPPSSPSSSFSDWFGGALTAVEQAGGNAATFAQNFQTDAADTYGSALNAASQAGADVQQFATQVNAPPLAQAAPALGVDTTSTGPPSIPSSGGLPATSVPGVPDWLTQLIATNAPPALASDPDFIRTVAAGAKAESGWDVNRVQNGYTMGSGGGARGLFQFDMGGMGAGHAEEDLLGDKGAAMQAAQIVPLYAKAYASAPQGLSGADKAAWVAAQAERPLGMDDPNSPARQNYATAYNQIGGGPLDQAGRAVGGAAASVTDTARAAADKLSQFGDPQLSSDEAYAACGPAAAVRFAQMYGRNPTLREATDLAATVGWSSAQGMAGIGSEKALMDKMGVPTKLTTDVAAMAKEAQTGNPVTISTQGHYFTADGYDPTTGAFHVGRSGLDLKGGSEWMTAAQMEARMGPIQGALLADNPQTPAPSTAEQTSNPLNYLGRVKDAVTGAIAEKIGGLSQPELDPMTGLPSGPSTLKGGAQAALTSPLGRTLLDAAVKNAAEPSLIPPGSVDVYRQAQDQRRQLVEGLNPLTNAGPEVDLPLVGKVKPVGALSNMVADIVTDPTSYVLGGPVSDVAEVAASRLPGAAQGVGKALLEGAGWGTVQGLSDPNATPQSVAQSAVGGAVVGGLGHGVASGAGRVGAEALGALDRLRPPETAYASTGAEDLAQRLNAQGRGESPLGPKPTQMDNYVNNGGLLHETIDGPVADQLHAALRSGPVTESERASAQSVLDQFAGQAQGKGSATNPYPAAVNADSLALLMRQLGSLADSGADHKDWYEHSSRAIMDLAGGDKTEAEKIAQLVAIYSPNTPVAQNMDNALTAYAQHKAGATINAPTLPDSNERARRLLEDGVPWDGAKTNNFYRNLMYHIDPAVWSELGKVDMGSGVRQTGATIDIWMQRALNSLRKAPSTQAQYDLASHLVSKIGEERGWRPDQAQAAIWTAAKSGWENTPLEAGGYHYGTAIGDRMARGYGNGVDHIVSAGLRDSSGADQLAREFGMLGADGNIAVPQARQSGLDPNLGRVMTKDEEKAAQGQVQPQARAALNAYTAARGLLGESPEQGWARPFKETVKGKQNAALLDAGNRMTPDQVAELQGHLDDLTGPGTTRVIPSDAGAWVLHHGDGPNPAFQTAVGNAINRLQSVPEVDRAPARFDGEVFSHDWSADPSGQTYRDIIRQSGSRFADRFAAVEDLLRQRVEGARADAASGAATDSGIPGGRLPAFAHPQFAASLGGGAAGAVTGYTTADPNATTEERLQRAALFGVAGLGAGYGAGRLAGRLGEGLHTAAEATPAPARERLDMSQIPRSAASQRLLDEGARAYRVPPGEQAPRGRGQDITATPAEERARLNLGDYPKDLQDIVSAHAEGVDWARLQRRGVIPDAVSRAMADRYANDTSLSQVIENGRAGRAYNDYQTRALRNATGAQAAIVRDVADKITQGGDTSDVALQRFATESQRLSQLTEIAEGARAESGRGLRAWQDPVRLVNMKPNDAVAEITKAMGGNKADLLDAIHGYNQLINSGAGPIQMANFWAGVKAKPPGFLDWFKLVRYNSMLSGPRTFEVNAIGNALELPWRLARDSAASTLRGRPGEIGVELSGAYAGLGQANRAFLDTLFQGITRERAAAGEMPHGLAVRVKNPVGKFIASKMEIPTRVIGAADEWARAIDYGMSMGRLAAVQASKEGLRGDAWSHRTAAIMANPETAPALMKQAGEMADRMTYKGDMGSFGSGLQAFTQRSGVIGNMVLPFLKTTYHITARGIDRSPVGLVGTGIDVARGAYGRDYGAALAGKGPRPQGVAPLGERLGDNLLGSAIFTGLYFQAQGGNISGFGPDSTQDKALLRSEGWQPYSVRVGDKWVSYANWGPAAIPFAMAAAAAETQRYAKPGAQTSDLVLDGVARTAKIAQEQTYLQAIGGAWKGITDPAQYGAQFVNDTITSLIPVGSGLNTVAAAFDPNARRVDRFNILDTIQSRLPGLRENVPAAQDVLGRPSPNLNYGSGALNPLRVSQVSDQPLLKEMDRIGYAPPAPPKTIARAGLSYELTPDEQRQIYETAGQLIAQRADSELNTDAYRNLNDTGKARRLQMIVDAARTQVENQWLNNLAQADFQQRRQVAQSRKEVVPVSGRP